MSNNGLHKGIVQINLRKFGNSTGLVLPPGVLKDLKLVAGQAVSMTVTPDGKIMIERKCDYTLAELLAQCDPDAPLPADLRLWDAAKRAGREIL